MPAEAAEDMVEFVDQVTVTPGSVCHLVRR